MLTWIYVLLAAALISWIVFALLLWRLQVKRIGLLQQLQIIKITPKRKRQKASDKFKAAVFQWSDRLSPLGKRFKLFVSDKDLERRIALAGHPNGLTLDSFHGFRFLCLFMGLLIGTFLSWLGLGGIVQILLILVGLFLPIVWIRSAASNRQQQIGIELPDFMDTMSVTLQAGVPMDPAIKQITRNMEGPLSEELTRFQQELDVGVPREDAYMRMMNRNQCKELETLVLSLIQGSKLGVPIANTFKILAKDMRESRIGYVKERAAKAGPKVTMITTFVILPAVLLCVMGLLVLNFIYNPEGIGIDWSAFS
ncbi:type II secretion system F family protein [Paenibacillus sp. FJAT-26967]|uniref:type II secretion system F family protein n=1 Tax=Paenibacillus sp. FJAT-26967 TaxID=1729690 RepID=UPI00083983C4|nr:type II secretion system F family protein [Paenibacillus sp. FJAT-26967]